MQIKHPHLFEPMTIRGKLFKNRILGGPLGYNRGNGSGDALSPADVDYYSAVARGGAARILGGGDCVVNPDAGYFGGMDRLLFYPDPPSMDLHKTMHEYVNAVHHYNCLAFVQFTHCGDPAGPAPVGFPLQKGPGPSNYTWPDGCQKVEMTREQIEQVAADFAKCAGRAAEYGLDGCLIHAGHGKLLDQFRARQLNHRTDEYGGSLENRARFPIMVMERIREAVGPDFIVELRLSAQEWNEDGITIEETVEFLKLLEERQVVDIFHITSGRHTDPLSNAYCISPATFPPAPHRGFCRQIKTAGIKTPLAIINSCADPDLAEDIVATGDADFVCMSRQINLADPYYPRKLHEGRPELIDGCLRCHGCYDVTGPCSVNPLATYKTYEGSYPLVKAPVSRTVCVVGGGIAGLKAAHTAAERGHKVLLLEQESVLGGQLVFSDTDTYKSDIRRYKANMIQRVKENPGIEVRLGAHATPETVEAEAPYAAIIALGATPRRPVIPGADGANVLTTLEAYTEPERLGDHVLMLGSGLTACEVALHLHRTGKRVSIVGRREGICYHEDFTVPPTAVFSPIPTFLEWFAEYGIALHDHSDCIAIGEGNVRIRDVRSGREREIACDTVILAGGMSARSQEAQTFLNCAPYVALVGDCVRPKKIKEAVSTGYWAAMEV